jgi:hypothetical protein
MKTLLKTLTAVSLLSGAISMSAAADDNIAACEIVVQQPVVSPDEKKESDAETTPMIATFIPAEDFIYSVFDAEDGHMTELDGHPIQALMCKRRYLIPTEFDLRLIETHIPLYLSQDFDSADSDLMAVYFKDDKYHYQYSGNDLSKDSLEILDVRMTTLNAQEKQ